MIKYIKGFDGLRALSIIMVLITHLGVISLFPKTDFFTIRIASLISGSTGVNVFFTLSGFLITYILIVEQTKNGKINIKNFFIKRFLRLLPPFFILLSIVFLLMQFNFVEKNYGSLLLSFFYLSNFSPNKYYLIELGHSWSLAVEEQFYLTWPFILQILKRSRMYLFLLSLIILSVAVIFIQKDLTIQISNTFLVFSNTNRWTIPAIAPIAIGSLAATLLHKNKNLIVLLFQNKYKMFVLSVLVFISPLYLSLSFFNFFNIIQAFGIGILLIWVFTNQDSKITEILNIRPLRYVGRISYGLYIYQGLFLTTGPTNKLFIQSFPQNILFTFIVAVFSYHFIEKKILALKNKFN